MAARLLAERGHRVCLLTRPVDPRRALANSLPPSTLKLLAQVGIADLVDALGVRTYGNTVWWGARDGHASTFSEDGRAWGYQVDRARLDPALLARAREAGVEVRADAQVSRVDQGDAPRVWFTAAGASSHVEARLVLDCSGRAGVLATLAGLRRQRPGGRMQALIGVWERPAWTLDDASHTFIETWNEGWAWSLPSDAHTRHLGLMVDGVTSRLTRRDSLDATYLARLSDVPRLQAQVAGATLARVFASDASVYDATSYAQGHLLLVGDAGATLNPLSSFGIKKALTSAWLASIVAHTMLTCRERSDAARTFFSQWESQVFATNLKRSREFAAEAHARHASAFWASQASLPVDVEALPIDEASLLAAPDVTAALAQLQATDSPVLRRLPDATFVSAPIVRRDVIALEEAVALGPRPSDTVRYVRGIDLVSLARLADGGDVSHVLGAYQRLHSHTVPADLVGCLALLVARGVLTSHHA